MTDQTFNEEQERYLKGVTAGLHIARGVPGMTGLTGAKTLRPDDWHAQARIRAQAMGGELSSQEEAKSELNPLDMWDEMGALADKGEYPKGDDVFLMKGNGLFYVAPNQDSYMCRLRMPGGIWSTHQIHGVADLAESYGGGYTHVTTRANLQIREIGPKDPLNVEMGLADIGVHNRGAGGDNIRNITGSPLAGIDPDEIIDVTPFARAMHHHILNHRELYGLPRKFNIAFDGGGRISALEGTNDIGFSAVLPKADGPLPRRPYFRMGLGGITGHKDFARDTGVMLKPEECVPVAHAVLKVFLMNGDRTDRDKARLKYVLDRWGFGKFMREVQKELDFTLRWYDLARCEPRAEVQRAGHMGVHDAKQAGMHYLGVICPVGRLSVAQMHQLADIADKYGDKKVRATVWQNVVLGGIKTTDIDKVKKAVEKTGLHVEATPARTGMVACTGSWGCKFGNAETKGNAMKLVEHIEKTLELDQPINFNITGCPNSCAQHYIGDIGLLGARVDDPDAADPEDADQVDGFHVFIGGGYEDEEGIAQELAASVPATHIPAYIENVLGLYMDERKGSENFVTYARRQDMAELRERLAQRSDAAAAAQAATEEALATDADTPEGAKTALEPTVESEAEATQNPQDAEAKRDNGDDQTNAA
ncbi:NirA family protein [uncultured Salinisphaera sp.]|uniref:NirA family protein n=1 Tax=uncultured Salinisphaera sp. TaxID=359372 RepID=UPI0032B26B4F|tara:strand:+ start:1279 stop:3225 length:1947 start_codon:yes stop_codon:yes gene_type:complete